MRSRRSEREIELQQRLPQIINRPTTFKSALFLLSHSSKIHAYYFIAASATAGVRRKRLTHETCGAKYNRTPKLQLILLGINYYFGRASCNFVLPRVARLANYWDRHERALLSTNTQNLIHQLNLHSCRAWHLALPRLTRSFVRAQKLIPTRSSNNGEASPALAQNYATD